MTGKTFVTAVAGLVAALVILHLGLQLYKVDPSRHRMYEEALRAMARGSELCASAEAGEQVLICAIVAEENRRIAEDAIASGRRS